MFLEYGDEDPKLFNEMTDDLKQLLVAVEEICDIDGLSNTIDLALKKKLENVYVQLTPCDYHHLEVENDWDYDKLLEKCRELLLHSNSTDSILLKGYRAAKDNLVGSNTYTSSSNISSTFIRSYPWRLLHSLLGSSNTSHILLNYNGFLKTSMGFIQLFGKSVEEFFSRRPQNQKVYNLTSALYKTHDQIKQFNPIPSSKKELLEMIFIQRLESVISYKKFESKMRAFSKISSELLATHQQFDYFRYFDAICETKDIDKENLSLTVAKKDVMRFCVVTFDAVFPVEIYGSKHNKAVILESLSLLIFGDKGTSLRMAELMNGIHLQDVRWLGKHYEGKWNKQDYEKRRRYFECFINWLFGQFFPYLLASFFHITHISSSKELLFFRHATWNELSNIAIRNYKEENLKHAQFGIKEGGNESNDFVLHCKFRIMPKKNNEFRVINVPLRGRTYEDQAEYDEYVRKEVRPTKWILSQLRHLKPSKFPKITATSDVPVILREFKEMTCKSKKSFDSNLYFIKFDVKECYDTLPQNEIKKVVMKMVNKNQVYFMNSTPKCNLLSGVSGVKRDYVTIDEVTRDLDFNDNNNALPLLYSGGFATSLRGEEIISIVESQLEHSCTTLRGEWYSRKRGVFQGLHLSSLFCDLIYDRLVDEEFNFLDARESIVLRLADDFLVLSTNKDSIMKSRKLIENGFPNYGIRINKVKTFFNVTDVGQDELGIDTFSFCGLQISIKDLSVLKQYDDSGFSLFRSHKKLTQKLIWVYKIRLSNNILNTNSSRSILEQVFNLATSTAKSYRRGTISIIPNQHNFSSFMDQMITETNNRVNHLEETFVEEITSSIIYAFLVVLKEKNTRYQKLIVILESKLKYRSLN